MGSIIPIEGGPELYKNTKSYLVTSNEEPWVRLSLSALDCEYDALSPCLDFHEDVFFHQAAFDKDILSQ